MKDEPMFRLSQNFYRIRSARSLALAFLIFCALPAPATLAAVDVQNDCKPDEAEEQCARRGGFKSIYIFDEIDGSTASSISHLNSVIPTNVSFPVVYVNSRGGGIQAGIAIGRTLRLRKASIKNKDQFNPTNQSECTSSCVLIAAGATKRELTHIGVHQAHTEKRIKGERYERHELSEERQVFVYDYLNEMGVNPDIINIMRSTPYNAVTDIHYDPTKPFTEQRIVKLGFMMDEPDDYEKGQIARRNTRIDALGIEGLKRQVEFGNSDAAYLIGRRMFYGLEGYEKRPAEGLTWLNKSADLGNVTALHNLGFIYSEGVNNVIKDRKIAVQYFIRSAKLGSSASQNNLAWHYYTGDGVEKNIPEAIYWVTRAVEQGESFAYGSLGTMRLEGNGFLDDDVETYKWFRLAVANMPPGNTRDQELKRLEQVEKRLSKDQIKLGIQLAREWRPLKQTRHVTRDKDDR
jgi:hypothetical protein